jgi:hypothetical protein
MTRKTLMAGAAAIALIAAGVAYAGMDKAPDKDWHGHGHGHMGAMHEEPGAMADHLMAQFDLNKDGKITKDEITRAIKQEEDAHFAEMDANHDGALSADELFQAHAAHMREHMDEMFKHFDKNGDGKITSDEFADAAAMMHHHMGMMGHHGGHMDDGDDDDDMPGPGGSQH